MLVFEGMAEPFCRSAIQVEEAGRRPGELKVEVIAFWAVGLTWLDLMDKGRCSMKDAFIFEPGSAWHSSAFNHHGESVRTCVVPPAQFWAFPGGDGQGQMWEPRIKTCLKELMIRRQFLEGRFQGDQCNW